MVPIGRQRRLVCGRSTRRDDDGLTAPAGHIDERYYVGIGRGRRWPQTRMFLQLQGWRWV